MVAGPVVLCRGGRAARIAHRVAARQAPRAVRRAAARLEGRASQWRRRRRRRHVSLRVEDVGAREVGRRWWPLGRLVQADAGDRCAAPPVQGCGKAITQRAETLARCRRGSECKQPAA